MATLPSTTVQSTVSMPGNLGIPSRFVAPSRPLGLSQVAKPSLQATCGQSAGPSAMPSSISGDWEQSQGQSQNKGLRRQSGGRGRGRERGQQQQQQHQVQTVNQPQQ